MILSILLEVPVARNFSPLIMIGLIVIIMYFFILRPQQQQRKKIEEQRKSLKIGDKIITSGGVHGKLKEISDTTYGIEVSEGVKITIDKSAVFVATSEQLTLQREKKKEKVTPEEELKN